MTDAPEMRQVDLTRRAVESDNLSILPNLGNSDRPSPQPGTKLTVSRSCLTRRVGGRTSKTLRGGASNWAKQCVLNSVNMVS